MAIMVFFNPGNGMTAAQYDESVRLLEEAGMGSVPGRLHHTCYGDPAHLMVAEIWDSLESFQNFGDTLMPILAQTGIEPGQPEIRQIHNVIAQ